MFRSLTVVITALVVVVLASGSALAAPSKTLDNLMAAYNGESNAKAKYTEFAKKADQEGFAGAASLFRAAAKAAGMRIGLISDLAIGMDRMGSHAWARRVERPFATVAWLTR